MSEQQQPLGEAVPNDDVPSEPATKPALAAPPPVVPVVGVTIEILSNGKMVVRKSEGSPRDIDANDLDYLLHRASRENEIQRIAVAVTDRQVKMAIQAEEARIRNIIAQRDAQQKAAAKD